MSREQALIALRRLGLGARPGDFGRVASNPKEFVRAQLRDPKAAILTGSALGRSSDNFSEFRNSFFRVREERRLLGGSREMRSKPGSMMPDSSMNGAAKPGPSMSGETISPRPPDGMMAEGKPELPPALRAHRELRRRILRAEISARLERAVTTDAPFVERLVMFWSNHFCISAGKNGPVRMMAGAYEREAIRPHVLGRFADLLRAVEQHPAMLMYLDNVRSFGPNSRFGRRRNKGLNENLAREIMELHTVGVGAGYTQSDVTSFARVLTGWSMANMKSQEPPPGSFVFRRGVHEPGDQVIMGRRYRDEGLRTGERVLDDLARHPATARMIAHKLAAHFVSENPPPELVGKLERTFRETDGDLRAVATTLIEADETWREQPAKVLPPYDFIISMMRGLGVAAPPLRVTNLLKRLGQPLWEPPSPKGWPDGNDDGAGPSAIRERLRIASRVARLVRHHPGPPEMAERILGPGLSSYARQSIARAQSPAQGFELLIMSPAFQRR